MQKIFNYTAMLATCLSLQSCQAQRLFVHSDYITKEYLASYHIDTPDPSLNCPPLGQRIVTTWSVRHGFRWYKNMRIVLVIRFGNHQQEEIIIPITKAKGTFIYTLLNEDYFSKNGILTYKADLIAEGMLIDAWRHQLWQKLIIFDSNSEKQTDDFNIEDI